MIAALEPLWWAQGITNVLLCVAWLSLKRRADVAEAACDSLAKWCGSTWRRVEDLEAAERARKELTK